MQANVFEDEKVATRYNYIVPFLTPFIGKRKAKDLHRYAVRTITKFGNYIKTMVLYGSFAEKRQKRTSDVDIAILVDDSDVKTTPRPELKRKLMNRLCELRLVKPEIRTSIHPQPILLSEFFQGLMEGEPLLLEILRTGIAFVDSAFFIPVQRLMKHGFIKATKEAVDKHMFIATQLLKGVREAMTHDLTFNLKGAIVNAAQALLMEYGYRPPSPADVPSMLRELVDKEKVFEEQFAKLAEDVIEEYKQIEHKKKKEIVGSELEEMIKKTTAFVEEVKKKLKESREKKGEKFPIEELEAKI